MTNGQLENPIATAKLKFDIGDHFFAEHFVVLKNLTGRIIGFHFMSHHCVPIDTTHGLIHFPHFILQVKSASSGTSAKLRAALIHDSITVPPMTTNTITAFVDQLSEWNTTGTVIPVEIITETASLIKSHSLSTIFDGKIAVRVTNTKESPYSIKRNTQVSELCVVTPGEPKFIRLVDTAILSMIREDDFNLTTHLNILHKKNQNSRKIPSSFQHPELLAKFRITPQYRHESSKKCANWKKKKS